MSRRIGGAGGARPSDLGTSQWRDQLPQLALQAEQLHLTVRVLDRHGRPVDLDGPALVRMAVGSGLAERFVKEHRVELSQLVAALQDAVIANQSGVVVDLTGRSAPQQPEAPSGPLGMPVAPKPLGKAFSASGPVRPHYSSYEAAEAGHALTGHRAFAQLPKALQNRVLGQIAANPTLARAYRALLAEAYDADLMPKATSCLMWQASHYQSPAVCRDLSRLARTGWLKDLDPADCQRAAKIVAHDAAVIAQTPNTARGELLRHTLDAILAPTGRFELNFVTESNPDTYGSAGTSVIYLDRNKVHADNGPLLSTSKGITDRHFLMRIDDDNLIAREMGEATLAHEVNHLVNGDHVGKTYKYFMAEYGAWYVGFIARAGREPTRHECYNRARYLLTQTTDVYANIRAARLQVADNGAPGPEAQRVIAFMDQFFDPPPSPDDVASDKAIVQAGHVPPQPNQPGPLPTGGRNMDNALGAASS